MQPENAADRQGPGHDAGQRALGTGSVHVDRVDHRVLQTVEEHRVVGSSAASDRHPAVRHVGRPAGPVADAGRRRNRHQLFPVQAPVGTAARLQGNRNRNLTPTCVGTKLKNIFVWVTPPPVVRYDEKSLPMNNFSVIKPSNFKF